MKNPDIDISGLSAVFKSNFDKLSASTDKNFQDIVKEISKCNSADALQQCLEKRTQKIGTKFTKLYEQNKKLYEQNKKLYEQNKIIYNRLTQVDKKIEKNFGKYSTDEQKLKKLHERLKELIGYTKVDVYLDDGDILKCCNNILDIDPDDCLARFIELATKESNLQRNVEIFLEARCQDESFFCSENKEYIRIIIGYLIRTGETLTLEKLNTFINKCEKMQIFADEPGEISGYRTEIEQLITNLKGGEYYNSSIDRDVFIIYANEDILEVDQLAKELEGKGLKCYYAARNLRNGKNAAANYEKEIKNAIAHCDCTVFVSSKNSRGNVNTRKERDWSEDLKPGAPHFEYLIVGYSESRTPEDRRWQAYFKGNTWQTKGQFDKLHTAIVDGVAVYKSKRTSELKYCKNCGKQFDKRAIRCSYCECNEFVATYEEYVDLKYKAEYEKALAKKEEEIAHKDSELEKLKKENAELNEKYKRKEEELKKCEDEEYEEYEEDEEDEDNDNQNARGYNYKRRHIYDVDDVLTVLRFVASGLLLVIDVVVLLFILYFDFSYTLWSPAAIALVVLLCVAALLTLLLGIFNIVVFTPDDALDIVFSALHIISILLTIVLCPFFFLNGFSIGVGIACMIAEVGVVGSMIYIANNKIEFAKGITVVLLNSLWVGSIAAFYLIFPGGLSMIML